MSSFLPLLLFSLPRLFGGGPSAPEPVVWPEFSAESATNAYRYVEGLVRFSPRDAGTTGAAYASQWLAQQLRGAGLKPHADVWRERVSDHPSLQFCNVWAEIPGETNTLVIVGSHYDTKSGVGESFQGANDGGSSTGIALEVARLMAASGIRPHHTIRFAFFDGEECRRTYGPEDGLHGSRRMARQLADNRAAQDVTAVVVFDMVGDGDLRIQCPRNVTPWLASLVINASSELSRSLPAGSPSALVRIADTYMIDDHWPFIEQSISAIDLIDFDYGPEPGSQEYWHTEEDTLDKISVDSLGTSGRLLVEILSRIDSRESKGSRE